MVATPIGNLGDLGQRVLRDGGGVRPSGHHAAGVAEHLLREQHEDGTIDLYVVDAEDPERIVVSRVASPLVPIVGVFPPVIHHPLAVSGGAFGVAGQCRVDELEDVVPTAVRHSLADILSADLALAEQQAQAELDQINAAMDELSRDLVAMQAVAVAPAEFDAWVVSMKDTPALPPSDSATGEIAAGPPPPAAASAAEMTEEPPTGTLEEEHEPPPEGTVPRCEEAGIFGAVAGAVGSLQAAEVDEDAAAGMPAGMPGVIQGRPRLAGSRWLASICAPVSPDTSAGA